MGTNYHLVTTDNPEIEAGLHIGKANGDTWMFQSFLQPRYLGNQVLESLDSSYGWFQLLESFDYILVVKDENNNIIDIEKFVKMLEILKPASIPQYLPDCLKARYYTDECGYAFLNGDWD
jgi:hypothetical protein